MYRPAVLFVATSMMFAQPPATRPKFEVASLKPSAPGGRGGGIRPAPGGERYVANNLPLTFLITVAYQVKPEQVIGGPDWINTDTYDMNAKAEKPSTADELHLMLQDLLEERFKLKFHNDTKEMPIYALTVDKGGHKMKAHEAQNAGEPWIDVKQVKFLHQSMHATVVSMKYFAWRLSQIMDRPVVDMTKLSGGFDFDLAFTREPPPNMPENAMINGEPVDLSGMNIYEAVLKQLGLKLEKQKGPVEVMVIDHVEKAVEN